MCVLCCVCDLCVGVGGKLVVQILIENVAFVWHKFYLTERRFERNAYIFSCLLSVVIQELHPSIPINSILAWASPKRRAQIERDATDPRPAIRKSVWSSERLKQFDVAKFPKQERKVWDLFLQRR